MKVSTIEITSKKFISVPVESVNSIDFSPDSQMLASASLSSDFGRIDLWDVENEKLIVNLGKHRVGVSKVLFSREKDLLFSSGYDGKINVWELNTRTLLTTVSESENPIIDLALDEVNNQLITYNVDGKIVVWDLYQMKKKRVVETHTIGVSSLTINTNLNLLASGGEDGVIKWWDLKNYQHITTINEHKDHITALAFDERGEVFFSASREYYAVWKIKNKTPSLVEKKQSELISSFSFSPSSEIVAFGYADNQTQIQILDLNTLQSLIALSGITYFNNQTKFSPNGKMIACTSHGKVVGIEIWSLENTMIC